MPEKTLIDVLDTAVKIGAGALISGISTYWVTKLKNQSDERKEFQLRYRNILEDVSESLEVVNHAFLKYWALVVEWLRYKNGKHVWSEARKEELEKTKEELFHAFKSVTAAEAKLLLIGEKDAYESLRQYGEKIVKFRRSFYFENMTMTEDEMEAAKNDIKDCREKFFKLVGQAYQKKIE